jgi:hypothetical protein
LTELAEQKKAELTELAKLAERKKAELVELTELLAEQNKGRANQAG